MILQNIFAKALFENDTSQILDKVPIIKSL